MKAGPTFALVVAAIALGCAAPSIQSVAAAAEQQDESAQSLVSLMEAGRKFRVTAPRGAIVLRPGNWSYPPLEAGPLVFEGDFRSPSGIWTSAPVGFRITNNEYSACPPGLDRSIYICGGVHSDGYPMTRRFTPSDHMLVILGNELRFDDLGHVYRDDVLIGELTISPDCRVEACPPEPTPPAAIEVSSPGATSQTGGWFRLQYFAPGPVHNDRYRTDYWISADDYGDGPDADGRVQVRMISIGAFDESYQPTWINERVIGIDCVNRSQRSVEADGSGEWEVLPDFVPGAQTVFQMCSPSAMGGMPSAPDLDTALTRSQALERFRAQAGEPAS